MVDLADAPAPQDGPEVAVIVPARNEAHQIAQCLRSLLAQEWPRLRVICVDDRSDDGTYEAARALDDPRLLVLRGRDLPAGWIGKSWANAQGVEAAAGAGYLLFTDADTVHAPAALRSSMAAAQERGVDLLSLFTNLRCETFWERLLLPAIISSITLRFPMRRVNDPKKADAIANGQYLLARRDAYDAVGGHAAIRNRVADDLELARLFKSSGRRLWVANGRPFVAVRMYTSLREIWWGFVKNATAGSGGPLPALLAAALISLSMLPFAVLPFAVLPFAREPRLLVPALAGVLLALATRAFLQSLLFDVPMLYVLMAPLAALCFAGIVLHSALRQLAGVGQVWKGRAIP